MIENTYKQINQILLITNTFYLFKMIEYHYIVILS